MRKKVKVIQDDMEKQLESLIQVSSTDNFPWYYQTESTSSKFPFFSHIVVPRYDHTKENFFVNSNLFSHIEIVLKDFCNRNKIKYTKMLRCSFNLMTSFKSYEHTDPHIDYPFPHKVCIMYLNDTLGDTVVFEETYEANKDIILLENLKLPLTIGESITPKKGLVVCFDGDHYHANKFCNENDKRIIIVMCFI
jgi:hypothetical protein